ncbi:MAG: DEAD/DEAH box helicase [Candidatus Woesearchaeota archaeon]
MMKIDEIAGKIPDAAFDMISGKITEFRPAQEKAIDAGLFDGRNLLICTPTASGKTLVAELAFLSSLKKKQGKTIYIVPLKALAAEKYKEFSARYSSVARIGLSIGNTDSPEGYLDKYDIIFTTSEKFDSLIRHHTPWLNKVTTLVVDEIHLLNDPSRGPTLEVILTLLRKILPDMHLIGLSATIGNPEELASWLDAKLIIDHWRPVRLYQVVYRDGEINYH